jgi:hypothetical protein
MFPLLPGNWPVHKTIAAAAANVPSFGHCIGNSHIKIHTYFNFSGSKNQFSRDFSLLARTTTSGTSLQREKAAYQTTHIKDRKHDQKKPKIYSRTSR